MKRVVKKYVIPHEGNNFRPYFLRAAGVIGMFVLIVGSFFGAQIQSIVLTTGNLLASVLPGVLVDLANTDRVSSQLGLLKMSPVLEEAARLKAEDMAAKGYFAHNSPEGITPWYWFSKANYKFAYAGENLAINFDDSVAVNTAWMNSPAHKANILNSHFTEIGIATAKGMYQGRETIFVVQMFGRPLPIPVVAPVSVAVSESSPVQVASTKNGSTSVKPELIAGGTEVATVPLASSTVKGASESQTFIAVENANELVSTTPNVVTNVSVPRYASFLEILVTSPTRTLAFIYLIIAIVLFATLVGVLFVQHSQRVRHILLILILFVFLCGLFYAYQSLVRSEVAIPVVFQASYLS